MTDPSAACEKRVQEGGPHWNGPEAATVLALVLVAFALRIGFAFVIPPFQAPDERAHFGYVEHLAREWSLPVQPEASVEDALRFWPQSYQPPLAYVFFVPVYAVSQRLGAADERTLYALRAQNALVGAATVFVAYVAVARVTRRRDARRVLAALVVALLPGFAGSGGALNNDGLANLLAAAVWLPLLRSPWTRRDAVAAGATFGAACLAKPTVLPLSPLLLAVPWWRGGSANETVRAALVAGAVAAAVLLPWLARNQLVYGSPLAIGAGSFTFAALAEELPAEKVADFARPAPGRALLEYVGQFGIYLNLRWNVTPIVWLPLIGVAIAGWLATRRGPRDMLERQAFAFLAALALAGVGLVSFSLRYYGGWQGRYLYPALLPVATLLACGWRRGLAEAWTSRAIAVAGVGLLALDVALLLKLQRFYAETPVVRWGLGGAL